MRQTVSILTALMIALTLISGFIVIGSVEQAKLLETRNSQIETLLSEAETQARRLSESKQRAQSLDKSLYETRQERDGLLQQVQTLEAQSQAAQEAALAVQTLTQDNDALSARADLLAMELKEARQALTQLENAYEQVQLQLAQSDEARQTAASQAETWEQAYARLQEEAAQDALRYEQALAEAADSPDPAPSLSVIKPGQSSGSPLPY